MDDKKFDDLVRKAGQFRLTGLSRRGLLGRLAAPVFAGLGIAAVAASAPEDADAKKRGRSNKKKRSNKRGQRNARAAVTPTLIKDNVNKCPDGKGVKVEPPKDGKASISLDGCKVILEWDVSDDKKFVSFTVTDGLVYDVYVKGGPYTYHYHYPNGTTGDTNLRAPDNLGGNQPEISHILFCDIRCPCKGSCEGKCKGEDNGCGKECPNPCTSCQTCSKGICTDVACGKKDEPCGCAGCCDGLTCVDGYCRECPQYCDIYASECCPGDECVKNIYGVGVCQPKA